MRRARLAAAGVIDGTVLGDHTVPAGAPFSITVPVGHRLRISDLGGCQGVDLLCYDAGNYENRYNAGNTIKFNRSIYIGHGFRLYSERLLREIELDGTGFDAESEGEALEDIDDLFRRLLERGMTQ